MTIRSRLARLVMLTTPRRRLVGMVARAPASIHTKLLIAFLAIVALLSAVGAVGLRALNDANHRTEELVQLQRKIVAYRQLQNDTSTQLYTVTAALLVPNEQTLSTALRQRDQVGYDLDRLQFVAQREISLIGQVQEAYDQFNQVVARVVELIRAGKPDEGRELQLQQAGPLADRIERLTNQLVNTAEADALTRVEANHDTYVASRMWVIGFAAGSAALALVFGYLIAWSLTGPVKQMDAVLKQIARGNFAERVEVPNRDELGTVSANLNHMSVELGRLYADLRDRNREVTEALERETATGEVLKVISRSAFNLQPVLDAVVENAVRLCDAGKGLLWRFDGEGYRLVAGYPPSSEAQEFFRGQVVPPGPPSIVGSVGLTGRPMYIPDALADPEMREWPATRLFGSRARLGVPILRDGFPIGVLALDRTEPRPFTEKQIELVETFADQAAIAIENVRLFNEIQEKSRELEVANRAKSDFLSRMSHELRTPLNAIIGFAEIMEMDPQTPPVQQEWIQHVLKAGRHLLGLINEVLDIARIEAGRLSLSPEPVAVDAVVTEACDLVRSLAARGEVSLEVAAPAGPNAWVRADRQRLQQVLLNLLTNAIKYNHPGGRVKVRVVHDADGHAADNAERGTRSAEHESGRSPFIILRVEDTGPGIPADKLDRLFTPFDRLGAEESAVEGSGLGLAIAKRLIEAMDGAIGVESAPGAGSAFWVELPRAAAPTLPFVDAIPSQPLPATYGASRHTATVLYIEDNLSNLELMKAILSFRPDITLLSAMQGTLGLTLAREHRPDLILLDLNLPDMHGDEVLARLRQDDATRALPVAVISADATPAQRQRTLSGGARAYLTKPLDVKLLLDLLNDTLARERATP